MQYTIHVYQCCVCNDLCKPKCLFSKTDTNETQPKIEDDGFVYWRNRIHTYTHIHRHRHTHPHTDTYAHTQTHTDTHTHTRTTHNTHMHMHVHICTHTLMLLICYLCTLHSSVEVIEVKNIYGVHRPVEDGNFTHQLNNKQLLFHSSQVSN